MPTCAHDTDARVSHGEGAKQDCQMQIEWFLLFRAISHIMACSFYNNLFDSVKINVMIEVNNQFDNKLNVLIKKYLLEIC